MSCHIDRIIELCLNGEPISSINPLPTSDSGAGPGSNVNVTDIEDGAGSSVMDTVNKAVKVTIVAGGTSGGAVTIADGADDALGATGDTAATTDVGTFSLIALFKRLLQKFTTQFPAALTGSGNLKVAIQEALPAGTNVIGQVSEGVAAVTYTDAVVLSVTSGGTSQELFPANADRTGLIIQNNSDGDLWIDFGVAAALAPPSLRLIGGGLGLLQFPDGTGRLPLGQVNIIGATTAQAFSAKEAEDVP